MGKTKKKGIGNLLKKFAKLPLQVKIGIPLVAIACVIVVAGFVVPAVFDKHETKYLAESDLQEAVNIESLSTVDYVYHGVAEKHSQLLWMDTVDYRVKYEAHIKAGYTMSDIRFAVDNDGKTVTAYLPEANIGAPILNETEFGYLPENATANIKDVIALCREDAANDVNNEEITREAQEGLQQAIRALTMPLLGEEWQLDFKPLAEFVEKEAADETE